jgi:hypothetical protein
LDSPLAQAKSLANHGQEITKRNREINLREKTREKNEEKTLKMQSTPQAELLSSRRRKPHFT